MKIADCRLLLGVSLVWFCGCARLIEYLPFVPKEAPQEEELSLQPVEKSQFQEGEHIHCLDGKIRVSRGVRRLFYDDFHQQDDLWMAPLLNYEQQLKFTYGTCSGATGLVITKDSKDTDSDTGFELISKPIKVNEKMPFHFSISAQGSVDMRGAHSDKKGFVNRIEWLNDTDEIVGHFPCNFKSIHNQICKTDFRGWVPQGATKAVIHIGADLPDIPKNGYLVLTEVAFDVEEAEGSYWPQAFMISRPMLKPTSGVLQWEADLPKGTSVSLQISTAQNINGAPGLWSPFWGPERRTDRAFLRSGTPLPDLDEEVVWVRYKAILWASSKATPVLKRVQLGEYVDTGWEGQDSEGPVIRRLTPAIVQDFSPSLSFELKDDTLVDFRTVTCKVDGKDVTANLRRQGTVFTYTPEKTVPVESNAFNFHTWEVKAADVCGNETQENYYFIIDESLEGKGVSLKENGTVVMDGQPFFPIGIYGVCKQEFNGFSYDKAVRELKKAGFNTLQSYRVSSSEEYKELLEAAEKYGMKVIASSRWGVNSLEEKGILEDLTSQRRRTMILGWYVAEESSLHVPAGELKRLSHYIRELDGTHLVLQADAVRYNKKENLEKYLEATDGFLPKLCPIGTQAGAAQIVADMKRLNEMVRKSAQPRTIWPLIQNIEGENGSRYPTYQELRCMSYLALIYGAQGIFWYTYAGTEEQCGVVQSSEAWQNMSRLAREIQLLQSVLLGKDCEEPLSFKIIAGAHRDVLGQEAIHTLYKKANGRRYLICANSSEETLTVRFTLTEGEELNCLFEKRENENALELRKNRFADEFAPYQVHVYELKRMFE